MVADVAILALDTSHYVLVLMLVALGLTIVFGLMNVINMAHGELMMLGAYTMLTAHRLDAPWWLGFTLAPLVVAAVGLLVEALVIRHVYHRFLDTILATWGVSLVLKQSVILIYGPASHTVPSPVDQTVDVFGSAYPVYRLLVMGISVLAVAVTFWLFFATRFGLAARGTIANRTMAACLGIDTRRLDRVTFAYGAGLAGLAGAAMAPLISLDPQLGLGFLVPAFLAVLVGGLGTLAGPLAGATAVGATDTLAATWFSPVWAQVVVFTMAIVVIRLLPRGIAGEPRPR